MATYVLGDLHGCFDTLRALWRRLPFEAAADRLWLVGDLANRGPRALETVRWARRQADHLGPRFAAVLGNHDLHLLRRAEGLRPARPRDTLDEVLEAPDGDALREWIAALPLLHRGRVEAAGGGAATGPGPPGGTSEEPPPEDGGRDWVLVHAGLWPGWSPAAAEREARRAEGWLRDRRRRRAVLDLAGVDRGPVGGAAAAGGGMANGAETADDGPAGPGGDVGLPDADLAAARRALYAFSELRTLRADGRVCDDFSGAPAAAPPGCLPWYRQPARARHWPVGFGAASVPVAFGHWAALGYHRGDGVLATDTGVIWGGALTAVRLEDGEVWHQENVEPASALPGRGP